MATFHAGSAQLRWAVAAGSLIGVLAAASLVTPRRADRPESASPAPLRLAAGGPPLPEPRVIESLSGRRRFVGTERCVGCHAEQAAQQYSRHAHTLSRTDHGRHARWFQEDASLIDPLEGIEYRPRVVNGRCELEAASPDRTARLSADYAFGAGSAGVTYLHRSGGVSTELRLTHYAAAGVWDFTPGQRIGRMSYSPLGHVLSRRFERLCFSCHTTVLVAADDGGLQSAAERRLPPAGGKESGTLSLPATAENASDRLRLDPDHSILGIGCEACHGAGAAHLRAVKRGDRDLRMVDLGVNAQRVSLELCGSCHRAPGSVDLSSPAVAAQLPRLQPVALSMSACFRKGGVSCMTCHDPHRDASAATQADYNAKCVACHAPAKPAQVACKVQPAGDCVSCHMPRQDIEMPGDIRFRNHWIKVWRQD